MFRKANYFYRFIPSNSIDRRKYIIFILTVTLTVLSDIA